jgi:molybdate transport system permease protein
MPVASQLLFPVGANALAARRWIERLDLSNLEDRLPASLSLGQQQRVALARALVRPAGLILLDEPFSALDAPLRRRLREEMHQLQREITATMVIVTHDPDEAALLGDEILLLDRGRVLQRGKTEAVFARPASETVARLLGAENVGFGIAVDDEHIEMGNGTKLLVKGPALTRNERVGWSVRPEHIQLSKDGAYEAIIEDVISFRGRFRLSVRIGDTTLLILTAQLVDQTKALCRFDIDPRSVQVWKAE